MPRMILIADLPRYPRCPICQTDLVAEAVFIWRSLVICRTCFKEQTDGVLRELSSWFPQGHDPSQWSFSFGLHWYVPNPWAPRDIPAFFAEARACGPDDDACANLRRIHDAASPD